jgi:hypothetical protein
MARKDFVGWAGLPPIAVFIEYILGIQSNYADGKIEWTVNQLEAHGIDRYPFGPEGTVDLKVAKRANAAARPVITVKTEQPFDLVVNWGGGQTKTIRVEKSGDYRL